MIGVEGVAEPAASIRRFREDSRYLAR